MSVKKPFRRDLKFSRDDAFLISAGNLFHKVGAATLNAQSPYDFSLVYDIQIMVCSTPLPSQNIRLAPMKKTNDLKWKYFLTNDHGPRTWIYKCMLYWAYGFLPCFFSSLGSASISLSFSSCIWLLFLLSVSGVKAVFTQHQILLHLETDGQTNGQTDRQTVKHADVSYWRLDPLCS